MPVVAVVAAVAVVMIVAELLFSNRRWPRVAGWWLRAGLLNGVQVGSVFLAGLAWDGWFRSWRPWSLDALGASGGAILGYLVITFIYYWWHRWRHEVPLLWRWFHQLHHSPQRIEIITSFYKHPLEIVANSVISGAVLMHIGLLCAIDFADLTLGMLVMHLFIMDPGWFADLGRLIRIGRRRHREVRGALPRREDACHSTP